MKTRSKKAVIWCPVKKRDVEVKFSVSGGLFSRAYSVVACTGKYDGDSGCDHRCTEILKRGWIDPIVGPRALISGGFSQPF